MEVETTYTLGNENGVVTTADFGRLFAHYRPRFEAIAYRYVRNRTVAEDLVSDGFISFWENRGRLEPSTNLPAYILTIVKNKCLDWLRLQNLHIKIEQEIFNTRQRVMAADIRSLESYNPDELFSKEVAALVRKALDELPELTREVFVAHRFSDMTYKQIGEKYAITTRRVDFELQKAAKELRIALKDYLPILLFLLLVDVVK